jgi:DNA-binding IclR family transcriptional regulator
VLLAARDRLEMVVLDSVRPRSAMVVARVDVGGRLSLISSALGRAYLAGCEPAEREGLITSARLAWPDEWVRAEAGCRASLEQARTDGFCLSLGEWHPELNTIATAFVAPTGETYALACGGSPITQTRDRLLGQVAPALRRCVDAIAADLGGRALAPMQSMNTASTPTA